MPKRKGNMVDENCSSSKMKNDVRPRYAAKRIIRDENGVYRHVESDMCHQCQRNDKGRVVRCKKCTTKRYCVPCMTSWYPNMTEEMFAENCPVCLNNCNCKGCLRNVPHKIKNKIKCEPSTDQKVRYSIYILHVLLPFLKRLNEDYENEKLIESKLQGSTLSDVQLNKVNCSLGERMFCDCCKTSIFDLHRSCPSCNYDLCLQCCRELRDGNPKGNKEVTIELNDPGAKYLHGGKKNTGPTLKVRPNTWYLYRDRGSTCKIKSKTWYLNQRWLCDVQNNQQGPKVTPNHEWKSLEDGRIPCPPESMGGCRRAILQLSHIKPLDKISTLLAETENLLKTHKFEEDMREMPKEWCTCSNSVNESDANDKQLRKAASRENFNDNYLYCPRAVDIQPGDLKHFQWHWSKGQPVIVSNVLETTLGLSWEPMVLFRAFRQISKNDHDDLLDVTGVNCLDWCEFDVNIRQFLKGYTEGLYDVEGWPQILRLNDWPPANLFEERLSRHCVEFISCLPFKEYTHPHDGYLNLATKLYKYSLKPDMGPQTYIAYGYTQELGRGDSVAKLKCDTSDVVNVLTHTATVTPKSETAKIINKLRKKHKAQDQKELFGIDVNNRVESKVEETSESLTACKDGSYIEEGGALWDIFRREDTSKLEEYLKKYSREFRHFLGLPLELVTHPIHDQTFYLTMDHKRRLKEEFGIEPWTFVQKLGDAVFIPAGCPNQVRNLKSCIKVALDFVSPENVGECIRLTEDFRVLPLSHAAQEDKLEVKKMALDAVQAAVNDLKYRSETSKEKRKYVKPKPGKP